MVPLLLAIASMAAGVWLVRWRQRRIEAAWEELAARLGLAYQPGARLIIGKVDGVTVQVDTTVREAGNGRTTYVRALVTSPDLVRGIAACGEGVLTRLKTFLGGDDVRLDLPEFDRRVHLEGDEDRLVASLDERERDALVRLLEDAPRAELSVDGRLVHEAKGRAMDPASFERIVERMVAVARGLVTTDVVAEVVERLARQASEEREPAVRQRALELLVRRHRQHPQTQRALEAALRDPNPPVRLAAALAVGGPEGFEALRELVETATATEDRCQALSALVHRHPYPHVAPVLDDLLRTGRPELRELAVRAIGEAHDLSRLEPVLRMATHGVSSLCEATATVLGQIGDARAEPALLDFLGHDDASVRAAAARSLGLVGTVAAVEPLLPHSTGLTTPGALKEAARDAIRRIQARLGPVESGRLSLVHDDGHGALSLAPEEGALALAAEGEPPRPTRTRRRA